MKSQSVCPMCSSIKISQRNWAKRAFGAIGTAAGATGGFVGTLRGAQIGIAAGALVGPAGSTAGGVAGALLGGIAGSAIGCEIGSAVGQKIDQHMLDNLVCKACGHTFSTGA